VRLAASLGMVHSARPPRAEEQPQTAEE
jgi:hypothetical protein